MFARIADAHRDSREHGPDHPDTLTARHELAYIDRRPEALMACPRGSAITQASSRHGNCQTLRDLERLTQVRESGHASGEMAK
jgi:hypothetical protein